MAAWNQNNLTGKIQVPINKYLTDDGVSAPTLANIAATDNYSITPGEFKWIVPTVAMIGIDAIARIDTLRMQLEDTASLDSGSYGNGIVLSGVQGVYIQVQDNIGTVLNEITQGLPIQKNTDWRRFGNINADSFGSGNETLTLDITIKNPIRMLASANHRMVFKLIGDFRGLVRHEFIIGGVYENIWH